MAQHSVLLGTTLADQSRLGWLAVAAVAAFPITEAARLLVQRPHVVLYGDQALLELGARRAVHLDQLVGPYSRNGFHHPGPAVLYLLAPFVRLLEPTGPGLYLGAVVINGAALIAAVVIFWRRLGPVAAVWAAVAIDVFCLCLGVGTLREPWNPYLVIAPMILFVVVWSAAIAATRGATIWALVIGSYLVQTQIATAPVAIVMSAVAVAHLALAYRRDRHTGVGNHPFTWAQVGGGCALALVWLPPFVELWRDRPDNMQLIWDFLTAPHGTSSWSAGVHIAADAMTIMPFGNHDYVLALHRNAAEVAVTAVVLVCGGLIAVRLGKLRSQPMSVPLVVSALLGAVIGTISLAHPDGPAYLYFAVWLAYVPLAVVFALGAALVGTAPGGAARPGPAGPPGARPDHAAQRSLSGRTVAICLLVAIAVGGAAVRSDLSTPSVAATTGSGPWPLADAGGLQAKRRTIQDTIAFTRAADRVLGPNDRTVDVHIGSDDVWPYVAGIVLGLDERGVQSTVSPRSWDLYFGHERAPTRPVSVTFSLDVVGPDPPPGTVIAQLDGAVLTYTRTTKSSEGTHP